MEIDEAIWPEVVKWIKSATERVKGSNSRSTDHFGGKGLLAVVRHISTHDLVWSYVVLCHSNFQSDHSQSPLAVGPSG